MTFGEITDRLKNQINQTRANEHKIYTKFSLCVKELSDPWKPISAYKFVSTAFGKFVHDSHDSSTEGKEGHEERGYMDFDPVTQYNRNNMRSGLK